MSGEVPQSGAQEAMPVIGGVGQPGAAPGTAVMPPTMDPASAGQPMTPNSYAQYMSQVMQQQQHPSQHFAPGQNPSQQSAQQQQAYYYAQQGAGPYGAAYYGAGQPGVDDMYNAYVAGLQQQASLYGGGQYPQVYGGGSYPGPSYYDPYGMVNPATCVQPMQQGPGRPTNRKKKGTGLCGCC